jgi:hypothetical protein
VSIENLELDGHWRCPAVREGVSATGRLPTEKWGTRRLDRRGRRTL